MGEGWIHLSRIGVPKPRGQVLRITRCVGVSRPESNLPPSPAGREQDGDSDVEPSLIKNKLERGRQRSETAAGRFKTSGFSGPYPSGGRGVTVGSRDPGDESREAVARVGQQPEGQQAVGSGTQRGLLIPNGTLGAQQREMEPGGSGRKESAHGLIGKIGAKDPACELQREGKASQQMPAAPDFLHALPVDLAGGGDDTVQVNQAEEPDKAVFNILLSRVKKHELCRGHREWCGRSALQSNDVVSERARREIKGRICSGQRPVQLDDMSEVVLKNDVEMVSAVILHDLSTESLRVAGGEQDLQRSIEPVRLDQDVEILQLPLCRVPVDRFGERSALEDHGVCAALRQDFNDAVPFQLQNSGPAPQQAQSVGKRRGNWAGQKIERAGFGKSQKGQPLHAMTACQVEESSPKVVGRQRLQAEPSGAPGGVTPAERGDQRPGISVTGVRRMLRMNHTGIVLWAGGCR